MSGAIVVVGGGVESVLECIELNSCPGLLIWVYLMLCDLYFEWLDMLYVDSCCTL